MPVEQVTPELAEEEEQGMKRRRVTPVNMRLKSHCSAVTTGRPVTETKAYSANFISSSVQVLTNTETHHCLVKTDPSSETNPHVGLYPWLQSFLHHTCSAGQYYSAE